MLTKRTTKLPLDGRRSAPRRGQSAAWRLTLVGAMLVGLLAALAPLAPAAASGPIWLTTQQATFSDVTNESVSMATYRNHAYILWLEGDASHPNYWVYYTTNASGAWKTRLLSKAGPGSGSVVDQYRALIAVDPSQKRLYAVWPPQPAGGQAPLVVYTSDDEGATWQGPTTLAHSTTAGVFPDLALAVGGGKAAVAFVGGSSDFGTGACKDIGTNDVFVVTYGGATWSPPRNVTSCADSNKTNNGWRTPRLAYDETTGRFSLVMLDDSNAYSLWSAQGSGTTWSTPALTPMSHLTTGSGDFGGLYQIAAAGGTTYVAYALSTKPGTGSSYVDVYLGTKRTGQSWATQRITQDPLNCQKADVSVAARPSRIALAYRWFSGDCTKPEPPSGPREDYIHVLMGQPGQLKEVVPFKPPVPSGCLRPNLSTDGDLFRVVQTCYNTGPKFTKGTNLYYTPEFLDVVGPVTHITGISAAGAGALRVAWTAQDPTPGSGVAYYQVQVRVNGGAWQNVVAATQSHFIVYNQAQAGKTYTFRVRARDKVNNWGAWVSATVQAT